MTTSEVFSSEKLIIEEQKQTIFHLSQEILHLKEQLEWFKRQLFGKKSEKIDPSANDQQLPLKGIQGLEKQKVEEEPKTIPAHIRRKPNRNGQDKITLPPDLPVERRVLDIPESQKVCPETGAPLLTHLTQK